jgi:hypothetical protein
MPAGVHSIRRRVPRAVALLAATLTATMPTPAAPPAGSAPPTAEPPATSPDAAAQAARVVVRESRRRSVPGFVEFEDTDYLFLRTLDGKLERFEKEDVAQVVRLVNPAPGQHGVVRLLAGGTHRGIVIEDVFEHVILDVEGVRTKFARENVYDTRLEPTFDDQLAHFRQRLRADLPERHYQLCQWLFEQKRLDLAEQELIAFLEIHDFAEGHELLRVVRAQLALERKPEKPAEETAPRDADAAARALLPEGADRLVTDADVNLVRVYEIDFRRPPKVAVSNDTIHKLIEGYSAREIMPATADDREALFTSRSIDIVRLMFALKARELYGEIEVLNEPHALNLFRQRVHDAWLMNNCATSRCHGGPDAGRLFLHRKDYKDARVRTTNLLILERLKLDPEWPLVNYDDPLASLIIQYGLPRTSARRAHPDVDGWRPVLRRPDSRMVQSTVEWIEAMMKPRVTYPVEYEPVAPKKGDDEDSNRRSR